MDIPFGGREFRVPHNLLDNSRRDVGKSERCRRRVPAIVRGVLRHETTSPHRLVELAVEIVLIHGQQFLASRVFTEVMQHRQDNVCDDQRGFFALFGL